MPRTLPDTSPNLLEMPCTPEPARSWLRDAAIALGVTTEAAEGFGASGWIQFHDITLLTHQRSDAPDDWMIIATIPRPEGVDESTWHDALLTATGNTMLLAEWAFGLHEDGAGLLTMVVPPRNFPDPVLLSTDLYGMLCVAEALLDGLKASSSTAAPPDAPAAPADTRAAGAAAAETDDEGNTAAADYEAAVQAALALPRFTPEIETLLREGVACLGGDEAAAHRAIEENVVDVAGSTVGFASTLEGDTLVLTIAIDEPAFASPQDRRDALRANMNLLACLGIAVGRVGASPAFIARWDARGRTGEEFAEAVDAFASLAQDLTNTAPARAV